MFTIAVIAPSSVPFVIGGAEKFWWGLHKGLSEYSGAYVDLIKLPCKESNFQDIVSSYQRFSHLDLSHFDMVVSTKYPAWMVSHPCHVIYLQHTLRCVYDTYHFTGFPETLSQVPTALQELMSIIRQENPNREDMERVFGMLPRLYQRKALSSSLFVFPGPLIREIVHFFDRVALSPKRIAAYAAISSTVTKRSDYFPSNVTIKVIHHPTDFVALPGEKGEYIFTASRLTSLKRQHLIIEAMRYVQENIPLRIAGDGPDMDRLLGLAERDNRIEFLGYVPDAQLPSYYQKALFVPFVPYDEDYGLITIEAMQSGKPVVTVSDSGGVCELVVDGHTGYCTDPTPEALGAAMQRLASDPDHAYELGGNAREYAASITWKRTIQTLLVHADESMARKAAQGRKKVLVVATCPVTTPNFGKQHRMRQLCQALAHKYFVELLVPGNARQTRIVRTEILPFFMEIRLPKSEMYTMEEANMAFMRHDEWNSQMTTLRHYGLDADFVVISSPFLFPAVQRALPDKFLVYDAHTIEVAMASTSESKHDYMQQMAALEKECCLASKTILISSEKDARRFEELYAIPSDRFILLMDGYDSDIIYYAERELRQVLKNRIMDDDAFIALFIGSDHNADREAIGHIKDMAKQLPEMLFLIAGSVCNEPCFGDDIPENIHFLGVVSEKEKQILLHIADVGLNPVTSGSGNTVKIVEYVAAGFETISTPMVLSSIDDGPLAHGLRIVPIEAFPEMLREAAREPLPEEQLANLAFHVADQFSWKALTQGVADELERRNSASGKEPSCPAK